MNTNDQSVGAAEIPQVQRTARITSRAKTEAVLRLLNGEAVGTLSRELGIEASRIDRWKSRFVNAGTAELARRTDVGSTNRWLKNWASIQQWLWLLLALVAVVSLLVIAMQHGIQQ